MAGIEWLTYDHFVGRIGERFDVVSTGDAVDTGEGPVPVVELVEATQSDEPGGAGPEGQQRQQFSLVFLAAADQPWPQGTYRLRHAELGDLDLFLVPLGRDARGVRYEAAFA